MDTSTSEHSTVNLVPFRRDQIGDGLFESIYQYTHCGFHPVRPGDVYGEGRYKVLRKLGYGSYSTVWLTEDIK
jgi:hypothetical protein